MSECNFTVSKRINRPISETFSAITDRSKLTLYFVDAASASMAEGRTITWTWDHWGSNEVIVKKLVANEAIELGIDSKNWQKTTTVAYEVLVSFDFEVIDERTTLVNVSESGWRRDEEGYRGSHDNCGGWQDMLNCLKAFLEYGVDLRK
jgi:uncharacterized protein YndB with AHSA1/START domain